MKRKTAVLALTAVMILTMSGNAYAAGKTEPVGTEMKGEGSSAEMQREERSSEASGCEAGQHQWSEWTVTIPADCVTEGQQTRSCELCGVTETASVSRTDEHDLKEISRQEATEDKAGFILYACKRNGCDYQEKAELPVKEASDPETADDDKNTEETTPEKERTASDSDSKSENKTDTDSMDEEKNNSSADSDPKENPDKNLPDSNGTSGKTDTEKDGTEELPDEDIDEAYASSAYATSSDVVTEYDPETAVSTRKVVKDPSDPSSAEEIEGMAVPEEVMKVKRDSDGNITELAVSTGLEKIRNGFSFSSGTRTLHSISIINEKDSSDYWITLSARKQVSELGIRMKQNADGMTIILTENEKPVQIVKAVDDEKKITLMTFTGGTCVISKHIQKFELRGEYRNLKDIKEISLHDMSSQKPYLKLISAKKSKSEESKTTEQNDAKDYWIQQYDDESETPIVITVYEK